MLIKARTALVVLGDIAALYLALLLTLFVRYGASGLLEGWQSHFYPFTIIFLIWLIVFYVFDLYLPKTSKNRLELAGLWAGAVLAGFLISIIAFYIFGSFFNVTPKTNLIIFTLLFGGLGFLLRAWQIKLVKSVTWQTKFIILGDSENLRQTITATETNPGHGYKNELWLKDLSEISKEKLLEKIKGEKIELLVIHPELMKNTEVTSLSYSLLPLGVEIKNFTDFYEEIFRKVPLEDLSEDWFIKEINIGSRFYNAIKRIFDLLLSLAFLITFSPLFLIIALVVKTTSPGPIIFKQIRVGRNGQNFTLYKFRTMIQDAERNGAQWAEKKDSRITAFGKILRHTHLDEMPQLWNILRGDLSFVGPRPERPEFTVVLKEEIPHYEIRHIVKPGLTGWAQVNYRYGASAKDALEKLKYDLYYIKTRSLILDLMIILKTTRMVFKNH